METGTSCQKEAEEDEHREAKKDVQVPDDEVVYQETS